MTTYKNGISLLGNTGSFFDPDISHFSVAVHSTGSSMEHLLGIAEKQIKAIPHQLRGMKAKPVVASNTL